MGIKHDGKAITLEKMLGDVVPIEEKQRLSEKEKDL